MMKPSPPALAAVVLALICGCHPLAPGPAGSTGEAIFWDTGFKDASEPPGGLLLSDNEGYWGESLLTGVEYRYESNADNPADWIANQPGTFGRRLLDGRVAGDWHVPVGQSRGPLVVVFDFKRPCAFTEVDTFCVRAPRTSLKVEVSDTGEGGKWRTVHDQTLAAAEERPLRRAKLPESSRGRYMRLSIGSEGITYVDEVLVWGGGEVSPEHPENIAPTCRVALPKGMLCSIPGMKATQFPPSRLAAMRYDAAPAIWAQSKDASPTGPILPDATRNVPLRMLMARNETESLFVTLTNPSAVEALMVTVDDIELRRSWHVSPDSRVSARLLIGGALPTSPPKQRLTREQRLRLMIDDKMPAEADNADDVRVLPFFDQGQMLGKSLMRRYLTNGAAICDYPRLSLPPGGSAVFMLRVTTDGAVPGRYAGALSASTDTGGKVAMELTVEVVDAILPELDLWVRSWGNGTPQFPFESQRRLENDARVNRQLGVTVWNGLPTPGSKAAIFGSYGRTYYRVTGIPGDYVSRGFCNQLKPEQLTAEDKTRLASHLNGLVKQAKELGLGYDEWWVELWDEPQETNVALFGAIARVLRRTNPNVRIYMNPLFWRPGHAPQEVVVARLAPWYNELVDISVPATTLVGDNLSTRELWAKPRFVRAFYIHPASRGGRAMAWKAFALGFNGWGYYCYYSPRGNPWDIRSWSELNYSYQMVFPGPNGPVITPIYEAMRNGWEDYRLLAALRQQGQSGLVDELLAAYRHGCPLPELRLKALEAFKKD